jgi:hypothetical protein
MSTFLSSKTWLVGMSLGVILGCAGTIFPTAVQGQTKSVTPTLSVAAQSNGTHPATAAADLTASSSGEVVSSVSAQLTVSPVPDKESQDITQTSGTQKDKLVAYLETHPAEPLNWNNLLAHAIRNAIKNGVPANILVLVLLFPLIASVIAASRHVIGLRGFGIYIPAVLAVALVSTGLIVGILVFIAIISVAIFSKRILKGLNLSYLPRTALLLWMIALAILGILLISPNFSLVNLTNLNIFPILILILLSENFLDAQSTSKPADALALAIETLVLAFVSGFALRWEPLQHFALTQPELLIIATAIFNVLVGKFGGLRLTEWLRFRPIIEE